MARVLVPLPDHDFDVTEVAVPWRLLKSGGHQVVFATETGAMPQGDPLLLAGVLFGELGAEAQAKEFYAQLQEEPSFQRPLRWDGIVPWDYQALLLPGGHAPGMRQYLAAPPLFAKVAAFWRLERPVAAICHGVLVLARTQDDQGRSLLATARTTCLPKYMERIAYYLTAWKLGRYYRTYPAYVEDEVKGSLEDPARQFVRGPIHLVSKGSARDDRAAFVVEHGLYLSARWPGDAYLLGKRLLELLK